MNKKLSLLLLSVIMVTVFAVPVFAQELKLSGEAKSGVYWRQMQWEGEDPKTYIFLYNADDSGSLDSTETTGPAGRYRLNMDYDNGNNTGMRLRFNWENFGDNGSFTFAYAFGYGNFFDDQMTVSVGKLGASPWSTGGPEMWKELETGGRGGMRVEWKPHFVPGLNVGFVLNTANGDMDQGAKRAYTLGDWLQESVVGFSYFNDAFLIRMAYRFDSVMDAKQGVSKQSSDGSGEDEFLYRIEEKVLREYVPGLSMWAMGYLEGITAPEEASELFYARNWLFLQYAPDQFTAQVRLGFEYIDSRSEAFIKPSFYWNFFEKLLSIGAAFTYCQDFGDGKMYEGSPYRYIEVEPKIQLNFATSYIAFAYNFRQEYLHVWDGLKAGKDPLKQTQWMNLRFCIYY